jgi:hypothetical protein
MTTMAATKTNPQQLRQQQPLFPELRRQLSVGRSTQPVVHGVFLRGPTLWRTQSYQLDSISKLRKGKPNHGNMSKSFHW